MYVYQNGMYECKTCVPAVKIKTDGEWQKVAGHSYYDEMMVKVVDDKHVEIATKKGGKEMSTEKDTLSDDGKTLTSEWVDKSAPNGKEVSGKGSATRVAAGPAGSQPMSGSWRSDKVSDMSSEALVFTYKSTPDGMDFSNQTGQSYSAKFNGGFVPIQGDPGETQVSIKKIGSNGLQETNKRNGKVVGIGKATVDGGKMTLTYDDKEHGTTMSVVADKQ